MGRHSIEHVGYRAVSAAVDTSPVHPPSTGLSPPGSAPFEHDEREPTSRSVTVPPPPPGQSPMLAWHRPTARTRLWTTGWIVGLLAIVLSATFESVDWMEDGRFAGSLAVITAWMLVHQSWWLTAGADWVRRNRTWVRTDELVLARAHGEDRSTLEMVDSEGRALRVTFADLQCNRELWNLVHRALWYSAQSGRLKTDATVSRLLRDPLR